jgi:hypothetical protein
MRSIGLQPAGCSIGRVFWASVEGDGRARRGFVDGVDDGLEQKETVGRQPHAAADDDAVVRRAGQLLLQHCDAGGVRRDHAKIAFPTPLCNLGCREIDAGLDLLRVESRRQSRIREVDRLRRLAHEQYARHIGTPLLGGREPCSSPQIWYGQIAADIYDDVIYRSAEFERPGCR